MWISIFILDDSCVQVMFQLKRKKIHHSISHLVAHFSMFILKLNFCIVYAFSHSKKNAIITRFRYVWLRFWNCLIKLRHQNIAVMILIWCLCLCVKIPGHKKKCSAVFESLACIAIKYAIRLKRVIFFSLSPLSFRWYSHVVVSQHLGWCQLISIA